MVSSPVAHCVCVFFSGGGGGNRSAFYAFILESAIFTEGLVIPGKTKQGFGH